MTSLPTAATGAGRAALLRVTFAALAVALVFFLQYRFVIAMFWRGAPLLDAGWAAYFLGAGDFWTHYPPALGGDTYFNTHLYAYAGLLGMAMHALGIDGITAFALHQGFAFAALAAAMMVLALNSGRAATLLLVTAALLTTIGDLTLQIASYPHIEIAISAFCLAGSLCMIGRRPVLALLAFALASIVREDGGVFAAYFIVGTVIISAPLPRDIRAALAQPYLWLAILFFLYSVLMFAIRRAYFPGFDVFQDDFSGGDWAHLRMPGAGPFLLERIRHVLFAYPLLVTHITLGWLAFRYSWRYAVFLVLILPLVVLYMLARRDLPGTFYAYYAIPWLDVWIGMFMVAALRGSRGELSAREPLILLGAAILGAAPLMALFSPETSFFVLRDMFLGGSANVPALREDVRELIAGQPGLCVSQSIAALVPEEVRQGQVIWDAPRADCRLVVGFVGDSFAATTDATGQASGLQSRRTIGGQVVAYLAASP
jgi:hypothetical protein